MQPHPRDQRQSDEALLYDHAQRLARFSEGRRAVQLHLSRLRPYNRRQHHLRIAASILEPLISGHEGVLFRLYNDDLIVVCRGASVAEIDDYVLRLRFLFSEDPLLKHDETDGEEFCSWYDLGADYRRFFSRVEALVEARAREEAERVSLAQCADETPAKPSDPIDPPKLGAIEKAIAQADLSHLLKRQAICAVAGGSELRPILHEVYISIEGLRDALLPSHDLEANHWLFRDLTRHLDRRMIALLTRNDDISLRRHVSINLNIETLLSPDFLSLDAAFDGSAQRGVMVELQLVDVVADPAGFHFARDFLHDRGYRICLDGTTHLTLPLVDRERLGVDLIKLRWSRELADYAGGLDVGPLRGSIERLSPERLILCRCDSAQAVELGRRFGISLFQGYHLDGLLARPDPHAEAGRLAAAAARHRRNARAEQR